MSVPALEIEDAQAFCSGHIEVVFTFRGFRYATGYRPSARNPKRLVLYVIAAPPGGAIPVRDGIPALHAVQRAILRAAKRRGLN